MGYFDNIPLAMRELKQWLLADNDKRPLAVDYGEETTYFASKTNPTQRMTYKEARYWAETLGFHIGFVPLPEDSFTIIDLDWKDDKVYAVDADEIKQSLYKQACESTYVEISKSGKGAHIVVEGKLPYDFNAQIAGIECYGNRGFVVMTGRMVSHSNVVSRQQSWLDWLQGKYPHAVEAALVQTSGLDWTAINSPSAEEVALDDALILSMSSWRNSANLEHYFYGRDLRPDGGGGSEGDMALMQAFLTFTKSVDKPSAAMRMFLKTPRAKARQPYKTATSNWDQYLARTMGRARMAVERSAQQARDYDFSEGSRAMLEAYMQQIEAAKEPVSAPDAQAPAQLPIGAPAPIGAIGEAPFTGFSWLTKSDLERLPALEWAVKGLYPTKGIGAIYGESGAGKSFVAIDLIAAMAEGKRWFGLRTKKLPVSVFALEGEGGLKGRVKAWELVNKREYPNEVYFWDSTRNGSFALRDADQRSDDNRKRLIQLCADLNANGRRGGVVVIDTLNQASDGADENSSRDMGELLKAMKFIQRETESLVLIVHHSTKSKENQSMRGHSSLYGAMDGVMEVIREVWTEVPIGSDEKPRLIEGRRGWVAKKVKDGRDGYTKLFDMTEVQVDMDEDGPVMSVAIKPVEEFVVDQETGEVQEIQNTGSLKPQTNGNARGRGRNGGASKAPNLTRPIVGGGGVGGANKDHHPTYDYGASAGNAESGESNYMKPQHAIREALIVACNDAKVRGKFGGEGAICAPRSEVLERAVIMRNYPNPSLSKRDVGRAIDAMIASGKLGSHMESGKVQWLWIRE